MKIILIDWFSIIYGVMHTKFPDPPMGLQDTKVKLFKIGIVADTYWERWHLISNCNSFFHRNKFVEFDMKPVCKKCYEKFPLELKKRLKKLSETVARK